MRGIAKILALALACAALSAPAAVVRNLPAMTVVETETVSLDAMNASAVRSSNVSVFTAALRGTDEAIVSGVRIGDAVLSYVDEERGLFAQRPVTVVPAYWDVVKQMFADDPEITVSIVGDKVVLGGTTANVETLRRTDAAKAFDTTRIVTQVTYSTAQIGSLVREFLSRSGISNINANVVGHEVCLSGKMYDQQSIDQLKARVEGFVKDFPGITVNTDELRIIKQKILIDIEFVAYNDNLSRNLGFSGPEAISASAGANFGFTHDKQTSRSNSRTSSKTRSGSASSAEGSSTGDNWSTGTDASKDGSRTHSWNGGINASLEGVQATINLLKQNGAAKTLYSTTLSTQSGIEAEFQNGGTIYRSTTPGMGSSGDMVTIEYGYIIKATPLIVDENTVNLDFNLDNKQPLTRDAADIEISRYQTKSKYLVRPGEAIMISGYKSHNESETKKGTPFLSRIPLIGPWLFGNTQKDVEMNEMLLVVTLNWALEDEGKAAEKKLEKFKGRKLKVDMP